MKGMRGSIAGNLALGVIVAVLVGLVYAVKWLFS
jgi:hypothetical protein